MTVAACGSEPEPLTANDDFVSIELDESVVIDVLANDVGYDEDVTIEIVNIPLSGQAEITAQGISYQPNTSYVGADDISYRIVNADGSSAEARIAIDVACPECLNGRNIRLFWTAPETNVDGTPATITGYRVYAGEDEAFESMIMLEDLTVDSPNFNFEDPGRVYDAWYDFGMLVGDTMCFRLTAYNGAGESDPTGAACVTIDQTEAAKSDFPVGL